MSESEAKAELARHSVLIASLSPVIPLWLSQGLAPEVIHRIMGILVGKVP